MKQLQDITQEDFEHIEQYLNKELPAEEAAIFEARMLADEAWRKKISEIKLLITGANEAALEEQLEKYHKNVSGSYPASSKTGRVFNLTKKWLAAASVLLIISLTVWVIAGRNTSSEKLYAKFFRPDPGLITAMGSSDDYIFDKAMVEYKEGHYKKAIEAWTALSVKAPGSDTLNYFLGVAYQAMQNDERARVFLSKVTSNYTSAFYKDACWYLGLSLLKDEEKGKAVSWIKLSGHPKSDELLNAINNK